MSVVLLSATSLVYFTESCNLMEAVRLQNWSDLLSWLQDYLPTNQLINSLINSLTKVCWYQGLVAWIQSATKPDQHY